MNYLGDYNEDDTVYFLWSSNDLAGASITRATDGTISVYKDNGTTQSTAGITDTEDFDSLTGIHACTIDLSADAFYATGADYAVVLSAATIDGQTVNAVLAHFSIENRYMRGTDSAYTGTPPTAAAIADAVLQESVDDHKATAASLAEHIDEIQVDTNELQSDDVPGLIAALNDLSAAEANAEVDTALQDIHLDHLLAADYDPSSKPGTATALLNELVENDGGVSRFTANALEQGPGGGGTASVLINTTIASVTNQTTFILTAGSDQDDAYNGQAIVIYDDTNNDYPCVRRVVNYTGSSKTIHLDMAPNFTIAAGDGVKIFVSNAFLSPKGATEVTDITIDDGTNPIEGAEVWITTGDAGTNTVWVGTTDASGNPKDANDENPFLDPGTYYIWVQKTGYSFSNPTSKTVS